MTRSAKEDGGDAITIKFVAKDVEFFQRAGETIVIVAADAVRTDRFLNVFIGDEATRSIGGVGYFHIFCVHGGVRKIEILFVE